jgi:type IV secretory pathway TraG/TraD family ATPase VirD4
MATQWGRKETVIWPPHPPIYTYAAVFMALVLMFACIWCRFTFGTTPLMQAYTPTYIKSWVSGGLSTKRQDKYRLLFVTDGKRATHVAMDADVVSGKTPQADGKVLPLALSDEARRHGVTAVFRGTPQSYNDAALYAYLKSSVFAGQSLWDIYYLPLLFGALAVLVQLPFSIKKDIVRRKEMKYGRRLKGPVMLTPKEFNKTVQGEGIGFKTTEAKEMMRIPERAEAQHIELMGDTGAGKTTLIMQILRQIQSRKHSAIVYDPACEFVQRFYDKNRGDIILNPLDARCPYWGPSEELRRRAEAKAIAASLYQPTNDKKGEFFTETPQKIFAHLLTYGPTPQQLVQWMSNPAEIDKRVAGTEMEMMIAKGAQQQRNGVLASLGLVADSLRLLPTREQAKGGVWNATEWSKTRAGWIFITSSPSERDALLPLHSLWIDLLVMRLLTAPQDNQIPVWFVLDELAGLQRLPQLHTAITENRKSKNPIVLGFQGKAQLETIYGHMAEVMLSQPATKIFLKTTEPKAAEWVSNAIGKVEIERMKETHFDGSRSVRNFTIDRQIEPLVMDSEISGLDDRHAFLKLGNSVARFHFDYMDVPKAAASFIPREVEDDELGFDPETLTPHGKRPQAPTVDLDQDPEPAPTRTYQFENDADQPTEQELPANANPDAPEDAVDEDELDEDERLAQPSFHFDRA